MNHDVRRNDGKLGESARNALAILWKTQRDDGGWNWLDFGLRPWERDGEYFGASMAAVAVGRPRARLISTRKSPKRTARSSTSLRDYLKKNYEKQPLHNRLFALLGLFCTSRSPDCGDAEELIEEVLKGQSDDGGWHFQKLGQTIDGENEWEIKASKPKDAPSDGYATALAVLALKRGGGTPITRRYARASPGWWRKR